MNGPSESRVGLALNEDADLGAQIERDASAILTEDEEFEGEEDYDEPLGADEEREFDPIENPDVIARFVDDSDDELVIERVEASHHGVVLIRSSPEGTHLTERQVRRLARLLINVADRGFIEGEEITPVEDEG